MTPSPHRAPAHVLILVVTLSAAACRTSGEAKPDPGPSMPPPAVAAAPAGVVTDEDVQDMKVMNVEEMLRGRIAGVEVLTLPSGGISVRIRGRTSVNSGTEPLYVVDGMPVRAEAEGALTWLNPRDVQRIEVLKDPGSTAFWGSRGANGVIVITTKH
ncbi:MAG TPA: TonB-dependent receptor plug domain-containing protein [Longimicrobium sp.]|jgi:TonB-dependent SusC/RagA subfamily outer membrane receptor|nr:TonB-dependent receptor plug domain-containing protein [Longimicrobium sp.]